MKGRVPQDLHDELSRLRTWRTEDAPAMVEAIKDSAVFDAMPDLPISYGRDQALAFIERTAREWEDGSAARLAIEEVATGRPVGEIGLVRIVWEQAVAEIGYWLAAEARGRGLATSALTLITQWAFTDSDLQRLEVYIDPDNMPSRRLAERCDFVQEGVLRSHTWKRDGRRGDSVVYGLLRSDRPSST